MPSIHSILKQLQRDYPHLTFRTGNDFYWSPHEQTIYYLDESSDIAALLHETAHALLGHQAYERDIQLLTLESDAWEFARTSLAPKYGLTLDGDTIENDLDSYREWMHKRSTCPNCGALGAQTAARKYLCPACQSVWRVNDARVCELRRYSM